MEYFTLIFAILLTYIIITFFDILFKTCLFYPYIKFLDDSGLTIKPYSITWETKKLNRKFQQLSHFKPAFVRKWFQVGAYLAMILMIPAFVITAYAFYQSLDFRTQEPKNSTNENSPFNKTTDKIATEMTLTKTSDRSTNVVLMPLIPGITLPLSQIYFYAFAMFVCLVIHEMGHAVAACRESITIQSCGIALVVILPVAFVKLPPEDLKQLRPKQLLRIFSAGIFHNIVLSLLALLFIWMNPVFFSAIFQIGNGISIISVERESPFGPPGGFIESDSIFDINDCKVIDTYTWENCLKKLHVDESQGFCVKENFIKMEKIAIINKTENECCPNLASHLCFHSLLIKEKFCLPGRKVAEKSNACHSESDCEDGLCLVLALSSHRLLKIKRKEGRPVVLFSSIPEIQNSLAVSNWTSNFRWLSAWYIDVYETALIYIVTFSSGITVINLIPCYGFDGAYLTDVILNYYFSSLIKKSKQRTFIINMLCFLGLFTIVGAVVCSVIKFMY